MTQLSAQQHAEVLRLINNNEKIPAIKLVIELAGLDLVSAKQYIEALMLDPQLKLEDFQPDPTKAEALKTINYSIQISTSIGASSMQMFENGKKVDYAEGSPNWLKIMRAVCADSSISTNAEYAHYLKVREALMNGTPPPQDLNNPSKQKHSAVGSTTQGIEDLTVNKKGKMLYIVILLVIIIVGISAFLNL